MPIDLEHVGAAVASRATSWAPLGVAWTAGPVLPNYGKPVVSCQLDSESWVAELAVWVTGEAELTAVRAVEGWYVAKHYELASREDLESAMDELHALLAHGTVPSSAVVHEGPL